MGSGKRDAAVPAVAGNAADPREHTGAPAELHAVLFDADGNDQQVDVGAIDLDALSERQLLWVDLQGEAPQPLLEALGLHAAIDAAAQGNGKPQVQNFGDWFLLRVVAISRPEALRFNGDALTILVGRNFVVSLHREPLEYLQQLRDRERAETRIGVLSAESFTASLLDWQMTTYFDAVAELEEAADRIEVQLLTHPVREQMPELAVLRRAASRLRRLLAPHRTVYGAMARPDFRPDDDEAVQKQFRALSERFERALDAVEVARELVIGSFELFATRTAQRTNDTMRVLTFVTVLLGTLAVVAGLLGMNFAAEALFASGMRGFLATVAAMVLFSLVALVVGKRRGWW